MSYSFEGYIFRQEEGNYYTIIGPDGRYLDRHHYFASQNEMIAWVNSKKL